MRRFIKISSIALAVLLVAMAVLPFALKGKVKKIILREVNKNLTAELNFDKLSLSLFRQFPKVYVGLHGVTLAGHEEFEGDTLARIRLAAVTVDLTDILGNDGYEIDRIRIVDPVLKLKVTAEGRENWDIVRETTSAEPVPSTDESEPFALTLKSVAIENCSLVYDDIPYDTYMEIHGLSHTLGGDLTADRTILRTQTVAKDVYYEYERIPYINHLEVEWIADIDADLKNSIYTLQQNQLRLNGLILEFEGSVGMLDEGYNLLMSYKVNRSDFKNFLSLIPAIYSKDFETVQSGGNLELDGYIKGMYTETMLPSFLVNARITGGWFRYPGLPGSVTSVEMAARIENPGGVADNTVIDVSKLTFSIMEVPVFVRLYAGHPVTDPYIDLAIDGRVDLGSIQKVYPLEEGEELKGEVIANIALKGKLSDIENQHYDKFQAMGSLLLSNLTYVQPSISKPVEIASAQFNLSPAYVDMVDLKARLGRSDFNASGKVVNYIPYLLGDGVITGNLRFGAGLIDLNELMSASIPTDETISEGTSGASLPDTTQLSPYIIPPSIDLTLDASIGKMLYKELEINDLKGKLYIRDQALIMDRLDMNLLGGSVTMNGSYETSDVSNPVVNYSLQVRRIDIPSSFRYLPIVEKLVPIAENIIGDLSGQVSFATILDNNMMPRWNTITGKGNMATSQVEIKNVNTLNMLSDQLKIPGLNDLKVAAMDLAFNVMDGVLDVKPFDFKAGKVAMNLSGWTSFTQEIGYTLKMKIPRDILGNEANRYINGLADQARSVGLDIKPGDYFNLDALIDGTLTDPRLRISMAGTGQDIRTAIEEEVREQVQKVVEDTKEKVSAEAEKILADAEARANAVMEEARKRSDEAIAAADKLAAEALKQANLQADNLEKEAKDKGALAVLGAKKAADEVRKGGEKESKRLKDEARKQSDQLLLKARQEADNILLEARQQADRLK